nr:MAG TPA: Putative binding domain, N-terminal [Caudoviricetes sp.]DAV99121.1 MAG TPA: Putative binding domain, N-terminal [Caudoviricetes sp.]DAW96504.1 MAG TPA: Putative binding domain, N-terminal [Bacteriophage sp.]
MVTVKVDENSGAKRTATVSVFTANEFSAVEVTQDGSLI